MKNGEILELYEALNRISAKKDVKFSVYAGYAIAKNKEALRQEAALIYKMRQDIIMEHGTLDDTHITVPKEYIDEVNQKIDELMEIETDVKLLLVPVDAFFGVELNMEDIEGLSFMIVPELQTGPPINE